jgi:hypothetical protein
MALPYDKRFPIEFEMASATAAEPRPAARSRPSDEPADAISRVARRYGWPVTGEAGRWVVDAGEGRRVLAEIVSGARGALLRFRRPLPAGQLSAEQAAELLRKNARTAHAGFSVGPDGRAMLVSTLLESSLDDDEVDAVLRSMIAGGEGVGVKPIASFDPSTYKTSAEAGRWESEILRESLGRASIAFQLTGPHAVANVVLDGGRHQTVHLLFDRADAWGDQLVQLISFCAPATPEWQQKALSANTHLAFAALALAAFGQQESLVAVRTLLARTADPDELLATVRTLAQVAARVE